MKNKPLVKTIAVTLPAHHKLKVHAAVTGRTVHDIASEAIIKYTKDLT